MPVIRAVLVLLVSTFLMMGGLGSLGTLLSLRLDQAAAPPLAIGVVMAAYFAGLTVGALHVASVIGRVGHIRAFSAFMSLMSAAALGHALKLDPVLWAGLRLLEGYCMAGLFVCVESWLNQTAPTAVRGRVLAFYMISLYGGQGVGQWLLGLDRGGFVVFVLASMLFSVALVPVALTRQTPPTLSRIVALGFRRLYAASPLGIMGTVTSGLVTGAIYSLGPVTVRHLGYGAAEAGLFMSAAILGGMILQWPLGRLSDVLDRRRVLVGLYGGLCAVSLALLAAPAAGFAGLLLGAAALGGAAFAVYPTSVAHTNDRLAADEAVAASGGLVLGYSLGAVAGPLGAAALITAAGGIGLFLFTALVGAVAAGFGWWRMQVSPPVPQEEQAPFVALPRTTPLASGMAEAAERGDGAAGGP